MQEARGRVLSSGRDGRLKVWELASGEALSCAAPQDAQVLLALPRHGDLMCTSAKDGAVRIWSPVLEAVSSFSAGPRALTALGMSANGTLVATADGNGELRVWELPQGTVRWEKRCSAVESIACGAKRICIGCYDGSVSVFDLGSGELAVGIEAHSRAVHSVSLSVREDRLLSASADRGCALWCPTSGTRRLLLQRPDGVAAAPIVSASIAPSGAYIVLVLRASYRVLCSLTGLELRTVPAPGPPTTCAASTNLQGLCVVAGNAEGGLHLWHLHAVEKEASLEDHEGAIASLDAARGGAELLVSGSSDGTAKVWDLCSGRLERTFRPKAGKVCAVAIDADGKGIVCGCREGVVAGYETDGGGSFRAELEGAGAIRSVAISASFAAAGSAKGGIYFLWRSSGALLRTVQAHSGSVSGLRFCYAASRLFSCSSDGLAVLWDTSSSSLPPMASASAAPRPPSPRPPPAATFGEKLSVLQGTDGRCTCIAVHEASAVAVTGGGDFFLRFWDVKLVASMKAPRRAVRAHADAVTCVEISRDGRCVVSGSLDGTIRSWTLGGEMLREIATGSAVNAMILAERSCALCVGLNHDDVACYFNLHLDGLNRVAPLTTGPSPAYLLSRLCDLAAGRCALRDLEPLMRHCPALLLEEAPKDGDASSFVLERGGSVVHVAASYAEEAFLRAALGVAPAAALLPRKGLGEVRSTLLLRLLEDTASPNEPALVEVLRVLGAALGADTTGRPRSEVLRLPVACLPYRGAQYGDGLPHLSDLIDVRELCRVAERFPDEFLQLVRFLVPVLNYPRAQQGVSKAVLEGTGELLEGSAERCPRGFWRAVVDARGLGDAKRGVQVAAMVLPLRDVAAADSPFLDTVISAAQRVRSIQAFHSELVQAVVEFKWRKIVRRRFALHLALYFLLLLLYIPTVIEFKHSARSAEGSLPRVLGCASFCCIAVLALYFVRHELLQLCSGPASPGPPGVLGRLRRLQAHLSDVWNALTFAALSMLAVSITLQLALLLRHSNATDRDFRRANVVNAATAPLLAGNFLYYLQGYSRGGALIRMIVRVASGTGVFALVIALLIVGFATSFHLLFDGVTLSVDDDAASYDGYTNFGNALVTVFVFILGDFSVQELQESIDPPLATVLLVVYLFLMAIVLLNLLIAIMSDRFDEIQENAGAEASYARALVVSEHEALIPLREKRARPDLYPAWVQMLKRGSRTGREGAKWNGKVRAIKEAQAERLVELEATLEDRLSAINAKVDALSNVVENVAQVLRSAVGTIERAAPPRQLPHAHAGPHALRIYDDVLRSIATDASPASSLSGDSQWPPPMGDS